MHIKFIESNKKLLVIISLVAVVLLGIAGTTPRLHKNNFKNLKVLPQDISDEALHKIMKEFNGSLGVHCDYCHAKNDTSKHLDFASDSNHVKESARYMMRMTLQINKDFLQVKQPLIGDSTLVVTCYTCHHGNAFPDNKLKDTDPHKDFMNLNRDTLPHKDIMPH